jgi:hypothetical protein
MQKILAAKINEDPSFVPLPEAREHAFVYSQFQEPRFHFYWHYHREVELSFIRRGTGLRYVGRSVEPCGSGDLVLLGSNLPHTWGSPSDQPGDACWTVIQLLPERWGNAFWQMPEMKNLQKLFKQAECGIQFAGNEVEKIGEIMESIGDLPPLSFDSFVALFEICRLLLAADRLPLNASPTPLTGFCNNQRLQRVLSLIDKQSDDPLSQADLAVKGGMVLKRAMSNPRVTSSLCGVRPARQLQMNLKAAAQPLDPSAVKELNRLTQPLLEKLGPSFDYYEPLNNDRTR